MFYHSFKKIAPLATFLIVGLALSSCSGSTQTIETPEVVIEKMLTEGRQDVYQSSFDFTLDAKMDEVAAYDFKISTAGRTNQKNIKKRQHEHELSIDMAGFMQEDYLNAFTLNDEIPQENPLDIEINYELGQTFMRIGDDYYATPTRANIEIDGGLIEEASEEVELIKSTVDIFMKPHLNKAHYVSLKDMRQAILSPAFNPNEEEREYMEKGFDFFWLYVREGWFEDVAKTGLIEVVEDKGLTEITLESGDKAEVYHFEVALDLEAVKPMVEAFMNRSEEYLGESLWTQRQIDELNAFFTPPADSQPEAEIEAESEEDSSVESGSTFFLTPEEQSIETESEEDGASFFADGVSPVVAPGRVETQVNFPKDWIDFFQEKVTVELWIGREDFNLYQMTLDIDLSDIKQLEEELVAAGLIEDEDMSEEEEYRLSNSHVKLVVDYKKEPIASFNLTAPEEVIDYSGLFKLMNQEMEDLMR